MKEISCSKVRMEFSDTINQVVYGRERIILERHGRRIAALVPLEDLDTLERLTSSREGEQTTPASHA